MSDIEKIVKMLIRIFPEGKKISFNNEILEVDFVDDIGQVFCKRKDGSYKVLRYRKDIDLFT